MRSDRTWRLVAVLAVVLGVATLVIVLGGRDGEASSGRAIAGWVFGAATFVLGVWVLSGRRSFDEGFAAPEWIASAGLAALVLAGVLAIAFDIGSRGTSIEGRPRRQGPIRRRRSAVAGDPSRRGARPVLALDWGRAAVREAEAAIAFRELNAELDALAAPRRLRLATERAARDEQRHARVCRRLAGLAPSVPPAPEAVPPRRPRPRSSVERRARLARVAVESQLDGVHNEGAEAVRLARLAEGLEPGQRDLVLRIAADEARHADLARATVAWSLEEGGRLVELVVRAVGGDGAAPRRVRPDRASRNVSG